ncbi:MAG TPA: CotH kinase family protein [Streptosporangiaceae bacterium]|nr:CotH kinase family protein [Streptosporangiaceae bacterium]
MEANGGAADTAHVKDEFFAAKMYMFHITGFPQQPGVLTRQADAPEGARLDVWRTDPADDRHIPGPGAEGVAFSTPGFSLANSGNRTLHAPKRSWKVTLEHTGHGGNHLAGMTRVNLKSMYNDPSQMREALAWRLFRNAGVPAARHTYAKLAFDATYYGLFSVIEQVDKRFLKDHFGDNDRGNLYKAYCGDVGCATLEHRAGPDGDDSGRQYFRAGDDERTYRLKSNEDAPGAGSYDDLAEFIKTINGIGLPGGDERFDSDAFRESVDGVMNSRAFLRWAAVNLLLGSWDNYYATPSNYYLYNSGRLGAEDDFMRSPYFTFIPWDYDNCLGIDYFGTKWQYTDILDWPSNTRHYWREHATSRIPLVQNLLRNSDYRQYYLDYLEFLLDTQFNPDAFGEQIAADSSDGLWGRIHQAAYLESATPYGQPFTGRQFTNDEVYQNGCKQIELRHGPEKAEGIIHYVRMRRDSARQQLEQLRKATPRASDGAGFPATTEPLPPQT